jgi:hypothetical protein
MTISSLSRAASALSSFTNSGGVIRPRMHLASSVGFSILTSACSVLRDEVARSYSRKLVT